MAKCLDKTADKDTLTLCFLLKSITSLSSSNHFIGPAGKCFNGPDMAGCTQSAV